MILEDRWYQTEAIEAPFEYWREYGGRVDEFNVPIAADPLIALPCGSGKSIVIGKTVKKVFEIAPSSRVIMSTHVKELVQQNHNKLLDVWPNAPVGIYSASLKRKVSQAPITFGNIQSMAKKPELFGRIDIAFIDECHLIPPNEILSPDMSQEDIEKIKVGNYHKLRNALKKVNPWIRFCGYTATKFRMGQGLLTDGGIFTKIVYDQTTPEAFNRMIAEGYLLPLYPKRTAVRLDISKVHRAANGDLNQTELQAAVDKNEVTWAALQEALQYGYNRNCWLVFCSGVAHAEHAAEMLNYMGIPAAAIHAELSSEERDRRIEDYKSGELRALSNNNVLTTGFDHPPIDFIIMLRPTISVPLWIQMLGRGQRPSPETGKVDCLVMDFAGNTEKLGPVNNPTIPTKKGLGGGPAPVKYCEDAKMIEGVGCGFYNHISARHCCMCGNEFIMQTHIEHNASDLDLLETDEPIIKYFDIVNVIYNYHQKTGSQPCLRVDYMCGKNNFKEFVPFDHPNARYRAAEWWRARTGLDFPASTAAAMNCLSQLRTPKRLKVHVNAGKHPVILACEYD